MFLAGPTKKTNKLFFKQQYQFYCGIDLHARKMYAYIIEREYRTNVRGFYGDILLVRIATGSKGFNEWRRNITVRSEDATTACDIRFVDNPETFGGIEKVRENGSCYLPSNFFATTAISGESGEKAEPATSEKNSLTSNPFSFNSFCNESLLKNCSQL